MESTVKTITAPKQIENIVKLINGERIGWDKSSTNLGSVPIVLEAGNKAGLVVEIGIGPNFFTAGHQTSLDARFKPARDELRKELLNPLGLPESVKAHLSEPK